MGGAKKDLDPERLKALRVVMGLQLRHDRADPCGNLPKIDLGRLARQPELGAATH